MPEFPEPTSQKAIRELLSRLQHAAADGELVSITVTMELASGGLSFVRTEPENDYALSGFMAAVASDIAQEKFYEDEIFDGIDDEDSDDLDEDDDEEEIGDPR